MLPVLCIQQLLLDIFTVSDSAGLPNTHFHARPAETFPFFPEMPPTVKTPWPCRALCACACMHTCAHAWTRMMDEGTHACTASAPARIGAMCKYRTPMGMQSQLPRVPAGVGMLPRDNGGDGSQQPVTLEGTACPRLWLPSGTASGTTLNSAISF